jgi:hypothetical protein
LSGCTAPPPASGENEFSFTSVSDSLAYAKSHGYVADVKLLQDGTITPEEYRGAENVYQKCLEKQGYTFGPVMIDPIGGLQFIYRDQYMGPKKLYDAKAVNRCQDMYDPVEESYTQTNTQHMEPQLLTAVEACLSAKHASYPSGATKVKDFVKNSKLPVAVNECINTEATALYPNIPVVSIAY